MADQIETLQNDTDIGAHIRSVPDFTISSQGALWGEFFKRRAPFEIFNFYLLLHYVADQIETSQNDTRHWCAQLLSP